MEEKIDSILAMYEECFKGLECSPLDAERFVLYFYINEHDYKNSLIDMDRRIYHQMQILKEFCKVYSDSCADFIELRERLLKVHKEIFKVLNEEFKISECWVDEKTDEIQYLREA